ncbi:MAG: hypothetical protein EBU36_06685 [Verrucomicrobia bacterium]|nr:hypothetical protein [Verrucomicrobiota bacterium]
MGMALDNVQAKFPSILATPPLRKEDARVSPLAIAVATGAWLIVGVDLSTVTLTLAVTVL